MIPEVRLSSQPVVAAYRRGDDLPTQKLQDFERGGIAIGDPTQGLDYQTWELRVFGNDVRIRPYPDGAFTTLFVEPKVQEIGFTFDQNMNPIVAYKSGDLWKLRWYDPTPAVQRFVITSYPGARDMRICLDERREGQRDFSDVMIFYLKDPPTQQPQRLYMRAQRDRYGVEYNLGNMRTGVTAIDRVGMAKNQRVRVSAFGLFFQPAAGRRPIPPFPPEAGVDTSLVLDFRKAQNPYYGSAGFGILSFSFELYKPPLSDTL